MTVGRIIQHFPQGGEIKKGDEKGFFEFGTSTIILLFKPDVVIFDKNIVDHSKQNIETIVKIGEKIGKKRNLKNMKNSLVIFDIDGTLTDSVQIHQECYAEALNAMDIIRNPDGFGGYTHHTDRYIFREIYKENKGKYPSKDHIEEFYSNVNQVYDLKTANRNIAEIRGAYFFIKNVLDRNEIPYVFATGSIQQLAIHKLSIFDIANVEECLSSSDFLDSRESIVEDAIQKAYKYYKRDSFSEKIILGDGKWDFFTAKNLGLSFLGIGNNLELKTILGEENKETWNNFENRSLKDLLKDSLKF